MAFNSKGKRIAFLATDGFEQSELPEPRKALDAAGAQTQVVSLNSGKIKGWNHTDWGETVKADETLDNANPQDYDALVLPGGVINPDHLRMGPKAVNFVQQLVSAGKTVGAICRGPWTLLEAGALKGETVASWPSLKTDLKNAGAKWVDQEVVMDGQFITSRKPDDIPAFSRRSSNPSPKVQRGGQHRLLLALSAATSKFWRAPGSRYKHHAFWTWDAPPFCSTHPLASPSPASLLGNRVCPNQIFSAGRTSSRLCSAAP